MCMDKIKELKLTDPLKERYAYKVFTAAIGNPTTYLATFFDFPQDNLHYFNRKVVPLGKWIKSTSVDIETTYGETYESGFHVFLSKKVAENYADWYRSDETIAYVVKVKVKHITSHGTQHLVWGNTPVYKEPFDFNVPVYVASYMYVPKPSKKTIERILNKWIHMNMQTS